MLGYIIPPIVIVISLGALIMFVFKKSAGIPEEMIVKERNEASRINPEKKKLFRLTQFFLNLTEKVIQRFKLVSLKLYNRSDNLFHSVKEKREKRQSERRENREPRFHQEGIRFERKRPNSLIIKEIKEEKEEEEEEIRPMISQKVVQPDSRTNVRNEFERALIERIAFNPRDIEAYERLGDYYIEISNFNDSLSCFEQVLVLSPVNRRAKLKVKRLQKIVFNKLD